MTSALQIRDLCKDYLLGDRPVPALRHVNLDVPKGDYIAIMGPSGSGKSTLLNLLGCLDQPTSGQYFIGHDDVAQLNDDQLSEIRAERIGFVFQAYNLISQLTLLENIEAPLAYGGGMSADDVRRCHDLARTVGLSDRLGHRPAQLSGGQQQRASIARSLINRPWFILADEATGNLDAEATDEILDVLDRLNEQGTTIVIVTHDADVARRARRIVQLHDGAVQSDERLRPPAKQVAAVEASAGLSGAPVRHHSSTVLLRLRDLRIGLKSLLVHPLRSLLTILGIFIGVASVIWLLAIGEGISLRAQQQIADLGPDNVIVQTERPPIQQMRVRLPRGYGLTMEDCGFLEDTIPSIEYAVPFCRRNRQECRFRDRRFQSELFGCTPRCQQLYRLQMVRGRFISEIEVQQKATVAVLAEDAARDLFRQFDSIGQSVQIRGVYYRVVGVYASRTQIDTTEMANTIDFSDNVYIPISTFLARIGDVYSLGNNGDFALNQITLRLKNQKEAIPTGKIITETLSTTHQFEDFSVIVPLKLLQQARNTRLMFMAMMGMVAAISLMVGGIGIMNIMLATVMERTREIGIRRALGAKRSDITRQFVSETIMLSVAGGITGIAGGLSCGSLVKGLRWSLNNIFPEVMATLPDSVQQIDPVILPWSVPLAFGISVVVGVVFGLYPAQRAAAMHPIDALRHVG